jgi:hypothetical protein
MAEKSLKISKVVSRYPEWWLALDDRIGYGDLDEDDRNPIAEAGSAGSSVGQDNW